MKKLMVIFLSFLVIAAMISVFSCSSSNPEEPAPTNTPAPTATNTPVPAAPIAYRFASDVEGWYVTCCNSWDNEQALNPISHDAENGHDADGCLSATTDFDANNTKKHAGNVEKTLPTYMNLTGKTITAWIYVPQAMADFASYNAQIYIKNDDQVGCDWCYSNGGWIDLYNTGWVQVSVAVNNLSGTADKTQVKFIGIQITKGSNTTDPNYDVVGEEVLFDDIVIQ